MPQCLSNSLSDRSFLPLVDGYHLGLRVAILVGGYPNGLHAAMRVE